MLGRRGLKGRRRRNLAYIDERFSVIPLGCSCQTNQQINDGAAVIAQSLGAKDQRTFSSYFDWLISPSQSIVKLVGDGLPIPETEDDILWHRGRPEFAGYGALFYHEFITGPSVYTPSPEGLEKLKGKFAHTKALLQKVVIEREPIFVWSNTQNNLIRTQAECDGLDLILTSEIVERIIFAGDNLAGRNARYVFVTYPDRCQAEVLVHPRATFHMLKQDSSVWQGDSEQWAIVWQSLGDQVGQSVDQAAF